MYIKYITALNGIVYLYIVYYCLITLYLTARIIAVQIIDVHILKYNELGLRLILCILLNFFLLDYIYLILNKPRITVNDVVNKNTKIVIIYFFTYTLF